MRPRDKLGLDSRRVLEAIVLLGILAVSVVSDAAELPFSFRKAITIDHTKVSGPTDLTDFPLLFSVTDLDLRTTGNSGDVTSNTGDDILFRALDDTTCGGVGMAPCTLDHELDTYDGTTGTLVAWVRIPVLSASSDTTLYIYYGNSDITAPIENPAGVWDANYMGVWHLSETSGQHQDSSANANDSTAIDVAAQGTASGQIEGADDFEETGVDDVRVNDSASLDLTGDFTISAWINKETNTSWDIIADKTSASTVVNYYLATFDDEVGVGFYNGGWQGCETTVTNLSTGQLYYAVGVFDDAANSFTIYVDGVSQSVGGTCAPTVSPLTNAGTLYFGQSLEGGDEPFDGIIDEVRISDTPRSADWIKTEYNNQNDPGDIAAPGFYTVGSEESTPPTAVTLRSFTATHHQGGVLLQWHTGLDVNNLGWHVYREVNGERVRLTPGLIAGSALMYGPGIRLKAGNSYRWLDPAGRETAPYWIKDRALNGKWTWHGPVIPVRTDQPLPKERHSTLLSQMGRQQASRTKAPAPRATPRVPDQRRGVRSHVVTSSQTLQPWESPTLQPSDVQHGIATTPAITLDIGESGWYRVTQPQLVAVGLDPNVDPRQLQLFVQGQQQAIVVTGEADGHFDPQDAIEFYGVGLDTPWTDSQTYWLVAGSQGGYRMQGESSPTQGTAPPPSFPFLVSHKERTLYLAMVKNGEAENFFGAVVGQEPVERVLAVHHLDPAPPADAQLEVILQGVTPDAHQVTVQLNGRDVGTMDFSGQRREASAFRVPPAWLQNGENVVTLVPTGHEDDVSVVDRIQLTYWHTYTADNDSLRFTVPGHTPVTITGFSQPDIRIVDITDLRLIREWVGHVAPHGTGYAVTVAAAGEGERILFAFTNAQAKRPTAIVPNAPSTWHRDTQGADLVIISHGAFWESVAPLKTVRESQGWRVVRVDVEDVYDAFNFGHKSPGALRDFLHHASTTWQPPPRFVLLVGDASFDPRNYLALDDVDFVPTPIVETALLETASDTALVDFDEDGMPELAIGRLPVRTVEEASTIVTKLVNYTQASQAGGWTREALLIADDNDIFDFASASGEVSALLSPHLTVEELLLDPSDTARLRSELLTRLNDGKLLVNYIGHGSTEVWAGGELLTSADARALTNGERLPVVVAMNCLNGFFHDLYTTSLAEALLKAEQGGAIAVWASSGLTAPNEQMVMNRELFRHLFGQERLTLGEAIIRAKTTVTDRDVQRTWLLFGDPTLQLP